MEIMSMFRSLINICTPLRNILIPTPHQLLAAAAAGVLVILKFYVSRTYSGGVRSFLPNEMGHLQMVSDSIYHGWPNGGE